MENGLRPVNPHPRISLRAPRGTEGKMYAVSNRSRTREQRNGSHRVKTKEFLCIVRTVQPAKPHIDASQGRAAELPAGSKPSRDKQARFIGVPP
jgi:hypothetical protein